MRKNQGIALVTVLVLLAVIASLVAVSSLLALSNRSASSSSVLAVQATYAAEAGIEMALKKIFYDPLEAWKASTDANVVNNQGVKVSFDNCAFKKWLTGIYLVTADIIANNATACTYVNFLAAVSSPPFPSLKNNSTATLTSPTTGNYVLDNGEYTVSITRRDDINGDVVLTLDSLGTTKVSGGSTLAQRRISRTLKIASDAFEGDRFAMLTTAANCSFCHLQIDSMRRAYSTTGSFEPVRVGFVTNRPDIDLGPNHGDPDVMIYGSILSRLPAASNIKVADSSTPANGARWAKVTNGKVDAGPNSVNVGGVFLGENTGSTTLGRIRDATAAPWSQTSGEKFYFKYPTQAQVDDPAGIYKGKWPDGPLPDGFPAAIPDGGDSHVSDAEWLAYTATAPVGRIKTVNNAVVYGVRRPSSGTANFPVAAGIPWVFDPISANGIADTATNPPANAQAVTTAPGTFTAWLLMQALASPNNRDYLPTTPTAVSAATAFNTVATGGSFLNNFYVNYNPALAGGTLSLSYCGFQGTSTWTDCARTDDPTNRLAANNLSAISMTSINSTTFFPQTSNAALADLQTKTISSRAGLFNGNVIIDAGTLGDTTRRSLEIEGTILINGDLVIRGKIYGSGRIVVRGNIYVVGDVVYACPDAGLAGGKACARADYGAADDLPKLAMLAGGHIIAGDYDAPDSRMGSNGIYNRAYDLINDQAGQHRRPSATIPWSFWSIPGSTGRGPTENTDVNSITTPPNYADNGWRGRAGFLTRVLKAPNGRSGSPRIYRMNPHGLMLQNGDSENYEQGGSFISGTAAAVPLSPLYPSNGPMLIGNRANSGVVSGGPLGTTIGCSSINPTNPTVAASNINTSDIVTNMPVRRFVNQNTTTPTSGSLTPRAPMNFSYWCPAANGFFVRNSTASTVATDNPSTVATAWMTQNARDVALDGGIGMTTGWLGGAIQYRGTWFRGDISQTRLLKLMWLSTMEGTRAAGPFRTDGLYYTANMIASMLRRNKDDRGSAISSTQARWFHNGSVIASELGFLITGNAPGTDTSRTTALRTTNIDFSPGTGSYGPTTGWGPGIGVFYDDRLNGFLQVLNAKPVKIKRTGVYAQVVTK